MNDNELESKRRQFASLVQQMVALADEAIAVNAKQQSGTLSEAEQTYLQFVRTQLRTVSDQVANKSNELNRTVQKLSYPEANQLVEAEFRKVDPNFNSNGGVRFRLVERGELFDWKLAGQEHLHDEYSDAVRRALGRFAGKEML